MLTLTSIRILIYIDGSPSKYFPHCIKKSKSIEDECNVDVICIILLHYPVLDLASQQKERVGGELYGALSVLYDIVKHPTLVFKRTTCVPTTEG